MHLSSITFHRSFKILKLDYNILELFFTILFKAAKYDYVAFSIKFSDCLLSYLRISQDISYIDQNQDQDTDVEVLKSAVGLISGPDANKMGR
jgi:hypothetical protein